MKKIILVLAVIIIFSFNVFSQSLNEVEEKWERYGFKEQGFSVLLPRLPVVVPEDVAEVSEETRRFGTYSNGVAYVVSYSQELRDNPLKKSRPVEPFSEKNFERRLDKISKDFEAFGEQVSKSESTQSNWKIVQLVGGETIYKLYFDTKSKNWIELSAFSPNDSKTDAENFFASFKFEKKPEGKEIGLGATSVIGYVQPTTPGIGASNSALPSGHQSSGSGPGNVSNSSNTASNKEANKNSSDSKVDIKPLRLVLSPRAKYTEEARKNNTQGTVRLRVTLAASGGVTSVAVISGLPYGLTEQAIAAARKMVFIPGKRNGVKVSISRIVEYGFNIY